MEVVKKAIVDGDLGSLRKLMKSNSELHLQRIRSCSALDLAARHSSIECAKELLKAGAKVCHQLVI